MIQTHKRQENIERDFLGGLESSLLKLDGKLKIQWILFPFTFAAGRAGGGFPKKSLFIAVPSIKADTPVMFFFVARSIFKSFMFLLKIVLKAK